MRQRNVIVGLINLVLVLVFMFSGNVEGSSKKETHKLIFADYCAPNSVMAKGYEWWAAEIERRTQGQVKFDLYWAASLVRPYEQTEAVINNVIQVGQMSAYNPDICPYVPMTSSPMMTVGSVESALKAADEFYRKNPELQKFYKSTNVKFLFVGIYSNQNVWSKVPIKTLSDFNGLSLRAYGPWLTLFDALGAHVVSLPVSEMYSALERGVVKATTQYVTLGIGFKVYEVTKYLITTNLSHCPVPIYMNINAWNKLPKDVKQVIEAVNLEMIPKYVKLEADNYVKELKIAKDHGMIFSELSPRDTEQLKEISRKKIWEPWAEKLDKKGEPGTKILQDYRRIVDRYSKR